MSFSKKECKNALERASFRLGKSPTVDEYNSLDLSEPHPSASTFYDVCDGFVSLKKEIGLEAHATFRKEADSRYFEEIESKEQAYWLGFIFGDGCVTSRESQDCLSVELHERDIDHLCKLKDDLSAEHSISRRRNEACLSVYDDRLVESLRKKGCDENKTKSSAVPNIPTDFRPDFIRGLVDADGTYDKYEQTVTRISIIGGNDKRFKELATWLPVEAQVYEHGGKYYLRVTGSDAAENLIHWMFYDAADTRPFLDRKVPYGK